MNDTPVHTAAQTAPGATAGEAVGEAAAPAARIGIVVVAYNAAGTLAQVLDRIPSEFRSQIAGIYVGDDASADATHLVALGYQSLSELPIEVIRHEHNLGYGGNQKAGYAWAVERGIDVVVLLHGDGQYAPEILPEMVAPILAGEAEAVFGSRMLTRGEARKGGMPLYKYVGNRILTTVENGVAGASLSEWHSGYRAYSVAALQAVPLERNSDGFDFDTEIIVQFLEAGHRIAEIPIPTYYGDEICHVNGMKYARDVVDDVFRYRAHKMGFGSGELAFASSDYEVKQGADSSHGLLVSWAVRRPAGRVLDLGCGPGALAAPLREAGHTVIGVDLAPQGEVKELVDHFVQADLDRGLPVEVAQHGPFDTVIAADVLEHVRRPDRVLEELAGLLAPGASVMISVPNFAHWYPRLRVAFGRFDYDRRGILDADHVRFFTRRSLDRLIDRAGFEVVRRDATGVPFEVAERGAGEGVAPRPGLLARLDRALVNLRPQLFAYQFLYELRPRPVRQQGEMTEA